MADLSFGSAESDRLVKLHFSLKTVGLSVLVPMNPPAEYTGAKYGKQWDAGWAFEQLTQGGFACGGWIRTTDLSEDEDLQRALSEVKKRELSEGMSFEEPVKYRLKPTNEDYPLIFQFMFIARPTDEMEADESAPKYLVTSQWLQQTIRAFKEGQFDSLHLPPDCESVPMAVPVKTVLFRHGRNP